VAEGRLAADHRQAEQAEVLAAQAARGCIRLDTVLVEVADRLEQAGIDLRVLMGPAIAHLDEVDPQCRLYADVDILIRADDLGAAEEVLGHAGFRRDLPERRPGYDRRWGKDLSLSGPDGDGVDLHRLLALGPFGPVLDGEALWTVAERLDLGGRALQALDREGRFVHACVNALLGDTVPKVVSLRDVAVLGNGPAFDPGRLDELAPAGRGAAVLVAAVAHCRSVLGDVVGDAGLEAAARSAPSRWERRALRCYRSQGGTNTTELLGTAFGLRWRERPGYLRALLLPGAPYRQARRAGGRPAEWRTGAGELVASLRRPRSIPRSTEGR
jgi:hypothetical protein